MIFRRPRRPATCPARPSSSYFDTPALPRASPSYGRSGAAPVAHSAGQRAQSLALVGAEPRAAHAPAGGGALAVLCHRQPILARRRHPRGHPQARHDAAGARDMAVGANFFLPMGAHGVRLDPPSSRDNAARGLCGPALCCAPPSAARQRSVACGPPADHLPALLTTRAGCAEKVRVSVARDCNAETGAACGCTLLREKPSAKPAPPPP